MKLFALLSQITALTAQTTEAAQKTAPKLEFHPERFLEMLDEMGIGMLLIFILIGVIILATLLINKIFSKNTK